MGISGARSSGQRLQGLVATTDISVCRIGDLRISDRTPNAAPEQLSSPPWSQRRTARRACSRTANMLEVVSLGPTPRTGELGQCDLIQVGRRAAEDLALPGHPDGNGGAAPATQSTMARNCPRSIARSRS
jgi:hypothetical protein